MRIARAYAAARVNLIYGGTNEIVKERALVSELRRHLIEEPDDASQAPAGAK